MEHNDEPDVNLTTTDLYGRRVWNKQHFAEKAAKRVFEDGQLLDEPAGKRQRKNAPPPSERRPLEERKEQLNLDVELGKARVISAHTPKAEQGGFWCETCECLIKDSKAYLDHINGRRHNRLLGLSMRVRQVDRDEVRSTLTNLKEEKDRLKLEAQLRVGADEVEKRLLMSEEAERARRERKRRKKKKKRERIERTAKVEKSVNSIPPQPAVDDDYEEEEPIVDDEEEEYVEDTELAKQINAMMRVGQ